MVILTQIAQNCEILLSPIFGSCLAAYISQKSGQPQVFSLFFPLFLPHLFYYYLSLQWFFFNNFYFLLCFLQVIFSLAGVGTVDVGVGVGVDAGAGVGAGTVSGESLLLLFLTSYN
jgi:hypothetical protein